MPRWLARLRRRFSPRLLRLGADGAQPLAGGGTSGTLALVGRELCLYLLVDTAKVPSRQRAEFVALAVRRAAPFPDPDFDALWVRDQAAVWYWSRERARAASGAGNIRFRAEALFRGEVPSGDLEQLLLLQVPVATGDAADAGVEARVWRRGRLVASRWWPQIPDARTWDAFARGAGLDASHPAPEPQVSRLRDQPLDSTRQGVELGGRLSQQLPMLAGACAILVLALLVWQAAGLVRAKWSTHLVDGWIAELGPRTEKIIAARERADLAQARIDGLLALRPRASQTRLLGEVKRLTPGQWEMVEWAQASPETLQVTFSMTNADIPAIVAAWEASPLLEEVTPASSTRPNEVVLQARLTGWMEPSP